MELPFDEDEGRVEFIRPDPSGFTIRTQYKDTGKVIDSAQRIFNDAPKSFKEAGTTFHHVGRVPIEVYEQQRKRLGRDPTARELVALLQDRDYSKLRTKDVKL